MEVRDAVEADAEALAELAGAPADVMRNLVHDRTVRVAQPEDAPGHDPDEPTDADAVRGFVSFDARGDTVHVTQLAGDAAACEHLLDEPVRFARGEGMTVELLVGSDDLERAAESAGFSRDGRGPRFEGEQTVRYRWEE